MNVANEGELRNALREWPGSGPGALLIALGFEPFDLRVPRESLADFGLDPEEDLQLRIAARYRGFHVLRVRFATGLDAQRIQDIARALHRHNPARRALLVFEGGGNHRRVLASWGLGPGPFRLRKLWVDPESPSRAALDILAALSVNGVRTGSELALAHSRALDREEVTRRFFTEFRRRRAELAVALRGVPTHADEDRAELALILLTRLLFLYFVQRKGWLNDDPTYLRSLYQSALRDGAPFYRKRLKPLFFGALNRAPHRRGQLATNLGELPYLNGGLFERHHLERAHRRLDVPDDAFAPIFHDFLDRYQFTLREDSAADVDVAIDPEMLGKVFEGLMAGPERGSTGAFFTPRELVQRLVDDALVAHLAQDIGLDREIIRKALEDQALDRGPEEREALAARVRSLRILDPAVGSGAFLLAAFQRLDELLDALEGRPRDTLARFRRREEIIRRSLHGVDVNGAAVHLCELRLWLALVVDLEVEDISRVPPLPNLDINIRQGDALLDPIDFIADFAGSPGLAADWARRVRQLARRRDRYFRACGSGKGRIARGLRAAERDLALGFLGELIQRIDNRRADLQSAAGSRDLFGKRSGLDRGQKKAATRLKRKRREATALARKIREAGELPFFSFAVHFAEPGAEDARFDIIVGNPPWIRTHRWTGLSRSRLKERFRFLRNAGWRAGAELAGAGRGFAAQLDLSALFLERSLGLLSEGGVIGFLLPAKLARGLSAGALRDRVIASTEIIRIEDHSASTERSFDATTYPLALVAIAKRPRPGHLTAIRCHDRRGAAFEFQLPQRRLPLLEADTASPWALAPPEVRSAMDRVREAGSPLGARPGGRPHRGLFTGANALFVAELPPVKPPSGGEVQIRIGGDLARIETSSLRPVLRGEDLRPWRYEVRRALLWTHHDDGRVLAAPPRATATYLRRHRQALKARVDLRPGRPYWTLFRARPEKWDLRVVWRDIASEPGAVVVPARTEFLGELVPIVSLNTVYQIQVASEDEAHLLAAVLNSTIARSYLKAFAERASGGYFRFLGWTAALLPYPEDPNLEVARRCIEISRDAHRRGGLDRRSHRRLDREVAALYGLQLAELRQLERFDAWLSNPERGT